MFKRFFRLCVVALAILPGLVMAAGEVGLVKAHSYVSYYKGFWHVGRFEVQVANLAFEKTVVVRLKRSDGQWEDFPLSYVRSTDGNREVWGADFNRYTLPAAGNAIEFAVRYSVNGQTYWDNNNGSNYSLAVGGGALLGRGVNVVANAVPEIYLGGGTVWTHHATLRNLAYAKDVKVIYSTDNWVTRKTAQATFSATFWNPTYYTIPNPNVMGFEEWQYKLDVGTAQQVEYAVSYTVNGTTYWDNNNGRNYFSRLVR